jgi:hypothetical protein
LTYDINLSGPLAYDFALGDPTVYGPGTGSVVGQITTDGTIGVFAGADILVERL